MSDQITILTTSVSSSEPSQNDIQSGRRIWSALLFPIEKSGVDDDDMAKRKPTIVSENQKMRHWCSKSEEDRF